MPIWRKEHELARVVVHFIGMTLTALGVSGICGQVTGQPVLYSWGFVGSTALPTAVGLALSGIAFFLVSRGEATHGEHE